jgi:hypothetical protein
MKFGDLQRCRVRQGVAVVCPDAESDSLDSGRAHFLSLKSRHRGARRRHNPTPHPSCGTKTTDPLSAEPQFGPLLRKQNPLKTDFPTAV